MPNDLERKCVERVFVCALLFDAMQVTVVTSTVVFLCLCSWLSSIYRGCCIHCLFVTLFIPLSMWNTVDGIRGSSVCSMDFFSHSVKHQF
jgi:hypothetical protein